MNPLNRRRLAAFKSSKRGMISLVVFGVLFFVSLFADLLANNKPILISYDGALYSPMIRDYPETTFGGEFPTNAVYTDQELQKSIEEEGWIVWPPIPYSYDTVLKGEGRMALLPPSWAHPLGTDDQARDVLARLIYGFRISVLFGLALTILSTVIGIAAGAVQGYFGGMVDLLMQRFLEIWSSSSRVRLRAASRDRPLCRIRTSFTCRSIVCSGLSDVIGSWKIMEMRLPRTCRSSRVEAPTSS